MAGKARLPLSELWTPGTVLEVAFGGHTLQWVVLAKQADKVQLRGPYHGLEEWVALTTVQGWVRSGAVRRVGA